jgi:DNA-binding MarR family transcriptional regulator
VTASSNQWKPLESFGGLVMLLNQKLIKASRDALIAAGLDSMTFGRFWVLHALAERPQNQSSLCRALMQSPPSMMEMLQRLAKDGLIQATSSKTDVRRKEWSLTAEGKKTYIKAQKALRGVGNSMDEFFRSNGISASHLDEIKKTLSLLCHVHFAKKDAKNES